MTDLLSSTTVYQDWVSELKQRIRAAQQRAALAVNRELVLLYWQIGRGILEKQEQQGWGSKVIDQLSRDLSAAFPGSKGYSVRSLKYMRKFAEAWPDEQIVQQVVAQIPWGHNVILLDRCYTAEERLAYIRLAVENGWSRNVMVHHIELQTAKRIGAAANNFTRTLPPETSDLARESLKDPYKFEFLSLDNDASERDIENALIDRVTSFLLELGTGFAFVGKQIHLDIGGEDFYVDLLFYHLKLHSYIVIELKTGAFKPEHLGQLNFYISVINDQKRTSMDGPTIGLLLCKSKNKVVAEYALNGMSQPMGVSSYEIQKTIQESLPTVEELERGLENVQLVGEFYETMTNYDLLRPIMICLGTKEDERYTGLLKLLDIWLSRNSNDEKRAVLAEML